MITLHDLEEAIAECQGERNPNANTCIKLAAFYTIRQEMFGPEPAQGTAGYSTQAAPAISATARRQPETTINYDSGSEFSRAIHGMDAGEVWPILDELLDVLQATNPRLYDGVIRKLNNI